MKASFVASMRPAFKAYMRPSYKTMMRPTTRAMNQAQKKEKPVFFSPELYPLFFACGVVICSATYFSTKHLKHDSLKLGRSVPTQNEKFEEVIKKN
ncbi:hypothetical protein BRETT_003260 [Brettanomyces bruxellensis]|uniref:Uncharacterized protein n=1 Tax=Dekkera bruxellensis TaxID=5007 RepID=A0A871RB38_DEKBR|nr:uncharacterized protein BRETT_003260 [Brettanomyces bruxellensis]QOU23069.1 hypothetical protein BRETT_003260 [Brettanomyces bruxellensis]